MTWRQFFTHMAIVVLGLLIAIGLEQLVEKVHQRHEVREAREALRRELEHNILLAQQETAELRYEHRKYLGDLHALQFLRAHPGSPASKWPAPIVGGWTSHDQQTSAWTTLRNGPVAALMPSADMQAWSDLYDEAQHANQQTNAVWEPVTEAELFRTSGVDPRTLSVDQLNDAIHAMDRALSQLARSAAWLEALCDDYAKLGYHSCLSEQEVQVWFEESSDAQILATYGGVGHAFLESRKQKDRQVDALQAQIDALDKEKR